MYKHFLKNTLSFLKSVQILQCLLSLNNVTDIKGISADASNFHAHLYAMDFCTEK